MADLSQQFISGARVKLKIDNKEVGYMTDLNGTYTIQNQRVQVAGQAIDAALVTVGVAVNFTAGTVRITTRDLRTAGFLPRGTTRDLLNWPEMTAHILDEHTDDVLITIIGCKPSRFDFRVGARTLMGENVAWEARTVAFPGE